MLIKKIRRLIKFVALLALFFIALLLFANHLAQRPNVQAYVIKRLSDLTEFNISTGDIELNLFHGIGISVDNFIAQSEKGPDKVLVSKIRIILNPKDLLKGRIVPERIYLVDPIIKLTLEQIKTLSRNPDHTSSDSLHPIWYTGIKTVYIESAEINIIDKGIDLEDLNLTIHQKEPENSALTMFGLGYIISRGERIPFNVTGDFLASTGEQVNPYVNIFIKTEKVSVNALPSLKAFSEADGYLHTDLWLKGSLSEEITLGGKIFLNQLDFIFSANDRKKQFSLDKASLDFTSVISNDTISIPRMEIKINDHPFFLKLALESNDKDNPYLNLEITSDFIESSAVKSVWPSPLLYPWFDESLFPVLESGKVQLSKFTARGYREQFHNSEVPENRSVFELELDCKDLTFAGKGIPLPFEKVSGIISWKDRELSIKDISAKFGDSVISKAKLSMTHHISGSKAIEVLAEGSFDLKELMTQKDMDLIPENVRNSFALAYDPMGRLECSTKFNYEPGWEYPVISHGRFIFRECSLEKKEILLPLKIREAGVYIYEDNINHLTGTGYWGNSEFRTTGNFEISGKELNIQHMDILTRTDMNQVLPLFFRKEKIPFYFNKPLTGHLSIEKEDKHISIIGDVDLEGSSIESEIITITPPGKQDNILFDINLIPDKGIDFNSLLCRLNGSAIELTGSHAFNTEDIFDFEINSPGISLETMGISYKEKDLPGKGILKGSLKGSITASNPGKTILTGEIQGNSLSIDLDLFSEPVKDCNFKTTLSGKELIIDQLDMKIGESVVSITGNMRGWDTIKGDLAVTSPYIDFFDFFPKKSEIRQDDSIQNSFWNRLDLDVDMNISKGNWKELKWGPLNAKLNIIDRDIHITESTAKLDNGILHISGYKKNGIDSGIYLKSQVSLKNQPINTLLENINIRNKGIRGSLDMEADLTMQGVAEKDLLPSLSGNASILISEGLIKEPKIFLKVLEAMSLQNILQNFYHERPPHLREKGLYFSSMQGDAVIDRGIAKTDSFVMKSPALNAVAIGEEDIIRKTHRLELFTQPLGTLETVLRKLPIVGRILIGDEKKSILTVGYKVTGSWSEPKVEAVPFESFGKGVLGILERLFLTPVKFIQDIHGVLIEDTDIPQDQPEER